MAHPLKLDGDPKVLKKQLEQLKVCARISCFSTLCDTHYTYVCPQYTQSQFSRKPLIILFTTIDYLQCIFAWLPYCEYHVPYLQFQVNIQGCTYVSCSRTVSVQALEESVADGKSELAKVVDAGHKLEGCTGAPPSSNLGYTTLEDRYLALKVLLLCIHHTHHGHTHSWTHSLTHSYTHSSISNTTWYIVASYYSTVYVHSKTGVFFSA